MILDLWVKIVADLVLVAVTVGLWLAGGQKLGWLRDGFVPPLLAFGCVWSSTMPLMLKFWVFLAVSAGLQAIRTGYGNYSPEDDDKPSFLAGLTHDRNGWWIRGIWGFQASLPPALFYALLTQHYVLPAGFVLLNTVVNFWGCKKKLTVIPMDILVSVTLCTILMFKYAYYFKTP